MASGDQFTDGIARDNLTVPATHKNTDKLVTFVTRTSLKPANITRVSLANHEAMPTLFKVLHPATQRIYC